jgi:hypothetical protein
MEQGAVPTQRAKSSVLKLLQHRIVASGCLAKRSTIGQDMHSIRYRTRSGRVGEDRKHPGHPKSVALE